MLVAVILAGVALTLIVRREGGHSNSAEPELSTAGPNSVRSAGARRGTPSAEERLRALLNAEPRKAQSFSQLESWVADLSKQALWNLIEESLEGSEELKDPALTVNGWLRAAAFAELGRRAPLETLAKLDHQEHLKTLYPALFAVYRGWGEADPSAAAAELGKVGNEQSFLELQAKQGWRKEWVFWKSEAYESIFRSWAAKDPGTALEALPENNERDNYRTRAWAGILGGVEDIGEIKPLLKQWLNEPVFVSVDLGNNPFGGEESFEFLRDRDRKRINSIVADRLMEVHDLRDAIGHATFGAAAEEANEVFLNYEILGLHSARDPDALIQYLPTMQLPTLLAHAVATARPERAVDVLLAIDEAYQDGFLSSLVADPGVVRSEGWYPAPERFPRLPDHEERLGHFRAAVEASTLPAQQKENLIRNLEEKLTPAE